MPSSTSKKNAVDIQYINNAHTPNAHTHTHTYTHTRARAHTNIFALCERAYPGKRVGYCHGDEQRVCAVAHLRLHQHDAHEAVGDERQQHERWRHDAVDGHRITVSVQSYRYHAGVDRCPTGAHFRSQVGGHRFVGDFADCRVIPFLPGRALVVVSVLRCRWAGRRSGVITGGVTGYKSYAVDRGRRQRRR
jgi:hypothetical protein